MTENEDGRLVTKKADLSECRWCGAEQVRTKGGAILCKSCDVGDTK